MKLSRLVFAAIMAFSGMVYAQNETVAPEQADRFSTDAGVTTDGTAVDQFTDMNSALPSDQAELFPPRGPRGPRWPFPPRRQPRQRFVTCYASDARGRTYGATGWDWNSTQQQAVYRCYQFARFCRPMGCR
jgi:hypothetical protein